MTNEIDLRVDRGEYVGGDTIYGSVYVRIQQQVLSSTLKLIIKGFQACKYDYQYVEKQREGEDDEDGFSSRSGQRTMNKDIIKEEIVLAQGVFPVGCYAYPFSHQLPHSLPGVYNVQFEDDSGTSWAGLVQYSVSALLCASPPNKRVSADSRLVIYDSLDCRNYQVPSQPVTGSGAVRTFFCISRGIVQVTCRLQQSSYSHSSSIIVGLDIKNDSSVDVSGYTVNLLRVIKLLALDRMRDEEELTPHTILSTILTYEGQGCPHNNTVSHQVTLDLGSTENSESIGVPPNTSGSIVKCNYVIDVNVHIPWGPDVEVRQPLVIKAADNEAWKRWTPPPWIDQCVKARTLGSAAVPEDILSSPHFAGIPGFH